MSEKGELIPVLEQIERDKGIKKDDILKMIEQALVSAYKKHSGKMVNLEAKIDPETAKVQAFLIKKVVAQVTDENLEITLAEARLTTPDAELDQDVRIPVITEDFFAHRRTNGKAGDRPENSRVRAAERPRRISDQGRHAGGRYRASLHRQQHHH